MKTSSMVWTIVIVLIVLGLGWYFWSQSSSATVTQTPPAPVAEVTPTPVAPAPVTTDTSSSSAPVPPVATAPGAPMTATVTYDGKKFSPASVTIAKGGTITFTDSVGKMWVASTQHPTHTEYDGTSRQQHCAAGATPSFDQCIPGSSYSFSFAKSGSFDYHDHINPAAYGKVIVK